MREKTYWGSNVTKQSSVIGYSDGVYVLTAYTNYTNIMMGV
jgi:hypothetical protein